MSINNIGSLSGFIVIQDRLSEQTRRKLIALGIDPSTVSSSLTVFFELLSLSTF